MLESSLYEPGFPADWPRHPLFSLARWVNGIAFRDIHFSMSGKPVIKIAEVKNGLSRQTKFTEQTFDDDVRVRPGDLIFSWSGQPETSIDAFWWRGPEGWLNQHLFRVSPSPAVDGTFLFFLLRYLKPTFVRIARNKQTTGLGHVTRRDLEALSVGVPALAEQRAIAEVLGALDDKIEASRRIIRTLRGLSAACFERALNKSALEVQVGDVAEFHNKRRIPLSSRERAMRRGPYPYYGAAGQVDSIDDFLFDGTYLLAGEDGTVVVDGCRPMLQYIWGRFWVNNHAHVMTGKGVSTELLRLALARADVAAAITGAVQPKLSMGNLKGVSVSIPEDSDRLEAEVASLSAAERAHTRESAAARHLRDCLLPELLSGELRVRDAELAVSEAV
jgi:type I restriction enzyme S subunit